MSNDLSNQVRLDLEQVLDRFVVNGRSAPEVLTTMQAELVNLRSAYERDPDPADDPDVVDEPSNEWPAA